MGHYWVEADVRISGTDRVTVVIVALTDNKKQKYTVIV